MRETPFVNNKIDNVISVNTRRKKAEEELEQMMVVVTSPVVVFGQTRAQAGTRRVTPTSELSMSSHDANPSIIECATTSTTTATSNGDVYTGSYSGSVPHGSGKYLWVNGCMYEGEWKRGKASGKGKFSWPSGATYEGEFKSGRMEGFGIYIGAEGDTYRGSWAGDRKQGYGQKRYVNGDLYEGSWKKDVQEGQGRFVWRNGNEYVGEWKNGVISGKGVLIWANGNRYDGEWENGAPKGSGVFTWQDGSSYAGNWSKENSNQDKQINLLNGTFYSGNGKERENHRKRSSLDGSKGNGADKNFPRVCIWEANGEAGDITCDIMDNNEVSMFYRDGLNQESVGKFRRTTSHISKEAKKPGHMISKGHKNYDLMINLQVGIRHSVGKHASISRDLKPSDFDPKEKFWTKFPSEGTKHTPPHQSVEFKWKDYCPLVFRHLRELFKVDPSCYMLAICGNDALRELSSPGKSGSFFYLTQDDRFYIKTISKSEVKVLIKMLPSYYNHVCQNENFLLTKFFGLHCVKPVGGRKTRFVVMGNLFCSENRIHKRFDLKGSSHGRTTDKPEDEIDETTTLKDLDLNYVFRLEKNLFQEFMKQIERDCELLEAAGIMDYSLLVGLHFPEENTTNEKKVVSPRLLRAGKKTSYHEEFMKGCSFLEAELKCLDRVPSARKPVITTRLGTNMPAKAEQVTRGDLDQSGSRSGDVKEVILYVGIIDILQDYDITKKLEHAYKSLQADPNSISAVDPRLYSKRFQDFIGKIFIDDR